VAYATIQQAKDLYGEDYVLTSVTRSDVADEDAFTRALAKASSEIDSYLGAQYTVPLESAPDIVVQYCVDIAIYKASADAGAATDEKRKRYDDALAWLKLAAKGTVVLDTDGDGEVDTSVPLVETSTATRIFSRTKMDGL
jgi:phage gp36-like protein